jgi:hypothetical protein
MGRGVSSKTTTNKGRSVGTFRVSLRASVGTSGYFREVAELER